MAYSDDSDVDVAGDWSLISRANGRISIRLGCNDDNFWDRAPATGSGYGYLHIRMTPTGETNSTTVLLARIVVISSVMSKFQ
jgi:hypothetical protein